MTTPTQMRAVCAEIRIFLRQKPHEARSDVVYLALSNWMMARAEVLCASLEYMKAAHAQHHK